MKVYEVGYRVSHHIVSVNMIEAAHVDGHELDAVTDTATRRAAHYRETVDYIHELTPSAVAANKRRGMPYHSIDSEATSKYRYAE